MNFIIQRKKLEKLLTLKKLHIIQLLDYNILAQSICKIISMTSDEIRYTPDNEKFPVTVG